MPRRKRLMNIDGVVRVVLVPDDRGRITIPKELLEQFRGYGFTIEYHSGKLILNPVKLEG